MKINLSDVTFTIPFFLDSDDRARNLSICIKYLDKYLKTNIVVIEQNGETAVGLAPHVRVDSEFDIIHRSRLLNVGALMAKTPIVVNHDCDVLLYPDQCEKAASWIREGKFDMVYPYSGKFLNLPYFLVEEVSDSLDISCVDVKKTQKFHDKSIGGAMFYNKDKFIEYGMENERLRGWPHDDDERYARFTKLGMRIGRTEKALLHMQHKAAIGRESKEIKNQNLNETRRIARIKREVLWEEIKSWPWRES